jgi:hypothetical protein
MNYIKILKSKVLLPILALSFNAVGQSSDFISVQDFDFIAEVMRNASQGKTACVLQYLDSKDFVSIDETLTFAAPGRDGPNMVVKFGSNRVDFILSKDKEGNLSWNSYNHILADVLSITGLPSVFFNEYVKHVVAKDGNGLIITDRGHDFIEVYSVTSRKSLHYRRSNLFMLHDPEPHIKQNGDTVGISLNLAYFLGESRQSIIFNLEIFKNSIGGYFISFNSPIDQNNTDPIVNCNYNSKATAKGRRPVFNENPLDFADGYNLNPYDLESYLNAFYYDLFVNAPDYFGPDLYTVVFKVLQNHKSQIYFKEIPPSQRNEASNILAFAWGMFDDCKVKIQVNPKEWHKADNVMRLWIIYHELCHDVFNLGHECGIALMKPTIPNYIDETMFIEARDELINYIYVNDLYTKACTEEFKALDNLLKSNIRAEPD